MLKRDRIFHKPRLLPSSKTRTILNRLQHFNTGKCCLVASWLAASRILGGERWQVDSHFHPVYCLFPPLRSLVQGYTKKGHTFIGSTGKKKKLRQKRREKSHFSPNVNPFSWTFFTSISIDKNDQKGISNIKGVFSWCLDAKQVFSYLHIPMFNDRNDMVSKSTWQRTCSLSKRFF